MAKATQTVTEPAAAVGAASQSNAAEVQKVGDGFKCRKCQQEVDVLAASTRKVGKTKGEWQCGTCFSVATRLRKMFGCWPIEDAADIPAEKPIEFYNAAAVSNGGRKLKLCLK